MRQIKYLLFLLQGCYRLVINFILENETKIGVAVLCAALVHIMGVVFTCQDHAHDVNKGGTLHCHAYFCYILQEEVTYVKWDK